MANQPTSFRYPFAGLREKIDPQAALAIETTYKGLKDINDAIAALVPKVNANTSAVQQINSNLSTTINTSTGSSSPVVGGVNDQTGITDYVLQQSDFGGLVILNDANPIIVELNSGISSPFYAVLENMGPSLVTLVPPLGILVNNQSSWTLPFSQSLIVFYDGINWWVTTLPPYLATHDEPLTDGMGNLIFAGGDVVVVIGVPN